VQIKKVSFLLFFILFISSCAYKEEVLIDPYQFLYQSGFSGKIFKGKLYLEGEALFLKENFSGGAYGDFFTSEDFLFITLKPPLSGEIHLLWKREESSIKIIDPHKKKVYSYQMASLSKLDLPSYFLGLKGEKFSFRRGLLEGEYYFSRERKEGELKTNLLRMSWKIREIQFSKEEEIRFPETEGFKEKVFEIPF